MHPARRATVDAMSQQEKSSFICKCLNGLPMQKWLSIYRALSWYVVEVSKECYEKVKVGTSDDGG